MVCQEVVSGVVAKSRVGLDPEIAFTDQFEKMLGTVDARPRVVIDRDQRVVWQSENAARLLCAPVPIQITNGFITADSGSASAALTEFVEEIGSDCDSLLVRGHSRRHWAMVMAWVSNEHPDAICMLLSLSVPHRGVQESGLASALRLTAAETRVLDQFARLNSPREIASRMDISLSTVRSHLKQIHSKSGVESAVQLTQLVSGYCSC
jgi:DNA-binding CsgD family transcriptional regulator